MHYIGVPTRVRELRRNTVLKPITQLGSSSLALALAICDRKFNVIGVRQLNPAQAVLM